jgi:immunoglobulin-binding protein 1
MAYEVIPPNEQELYTNASAVADPARRRDLKLKQWKQEKDLKTQIEVCHPLLLTDSHL